MRTLRFLSAILFYAAAASAQRQIVLVGLGDSLGEGVQSGDANRRTQPNSYLNRVATQLGASFPLPLIRTQPFGFVGGTLSRFRADPSVNGQNLAVSGADVNSIINDVADAKIDSETDLVLQPRFGSQLDVATSLEPSHIICWIGNNDALSSVASFNKLDTSQLTPLADFQRDYTTIARRLGNTGASYIVLGNIPSVAGIAFTMGPQDLQLFLGNSYGLPQGSFTTVPTMLLIKLGLLQPSILQNPDYVLDPGEVTTINNRISQFNQVIASSARSLGAVVADVNGVFNALAANPPVIDGVGLKTRFLGGAFSLDAVHPSDIGHALVANAFIDALNAKFQFNVPRISPAQLVQIIRADPFIDRNNNLKVKGRPLAGIIETLAPFLGISGDRADLPVKPGVIQPELGQALVREYLAYKGLPSDRARSWTPQDSVNMMAEIFAGVTSKRGR